MIGISALHFDPLGSRIFRQAENMLDNRSGNRRVSRTATLDGGCAIYDTGFTDSDRTLTAAQKHPMPADIDFAHHVVAHCPEVVVSAVDGCYIGVPRDYRIVNNELRLDILIKRRIS